VTREWLKISFWN